MSAGCRHERRRDPILVTGSYRSGTTWVGKMMASHPGVFYLQEPFNPLHRRSISPVRFFNEYVTPASAPAFTSFLQQLFRFPTHWWSEVSARPRPRRIVGATLRALQTYWRRLRGVRPLMKDPLALMSADWLARTFHMDVIVLIRHPAAFAASVKRVGARLGFNVLQSQPALIERYLQSFADQIDDFARRQASVGTYDIVNEAILTWRLIHHVIHCHRLEHPEWCFVRHEDLSHRPLDGFRRLFDYAGVPWTTKSARVIAEHSASHNPCATPGKFGHQLKLNSSANVWSWTRLLTADEVRRLRLGTEDVAHHFYADVDWQVPKLAAA